MTATKVWGRIFLTREAAAKLAATDRDYYVRRTRDGKGWCVWDAVSDHVVEFEFNEGDDNGTISSA